MPYKYRVKSSCSIATASDKLPLLRGGTLVPDNILTEAQIKEHLRSGYLEAVNRTEAPEPEGLVGPEAPGVPKPPVLPSKETPDGPVALSDDPNRRSQAEFDNVMHEPEQPIKSQKSLWVVNPSNLKNKNVDELNVMISERDPSVKPFETSEEAAAFLSADFD